MKGDLDPVAFDAWERGLTIKALRDRLVKLENERDEARREGWQQAIQAAVAVLEQQTYAIAHDLPDDHGGAFTKRYARNALASTMALIEQLEPSLPPPARDGASASTE